MAKVLNKEEVPSIHKEKPAEDDEEDVDDGNVPFDRSPSGRNTS
jgi:hypothetical protein